MTRAPRFTLHAPDGTRLVGFDNAHDVPARGSRFKRRNESTDHWHARRRIWVDPTSSKTLRRCSTTSSTRWSASCATVELACGSRERKHHGGRNEARQGSEPAIAARENEGRGP